MLTSCFFKSMVWALNKTLLIYQKSNQKPIMHNNLWMPDVVVGIDFGMTCTGALFPCIYFNTKLTLLNRRRVVPRARLARAKSSPTLARKNGQRARK